MKKIIAVVLSFLLAASSFAQQTEYSMTFIRDKDGQLVVIDNEKDWKLIGSAAIFDLYIDKYMLEQMKDDYYLHGVTIYKPGEEQKFDGLPFTVKKIYTYGHLVCKDKVLYVLNQWYTTEKGVIVYSQSYNYGEFISDMNDPNTTRNKAYHLLCGEKV